MPDTILKTKLYIPPARSKLVLRPHLISRLSEGLAGKLMLVSAPAGSGKTTLVSEWIHRLAGEDQAVASAFPAVAWLSLDEDDNDVARFWSYVIAALDTIRPGVGTDALAMLRSAQPPPYQTILTALINDLDDRPDPLALILDDYHAIHVQPIHDALAYLLDHLPPHTHLIIATRADPPLPLSSLRARRQLVEVRADDLRFTPGEIAAFLNQIMGLGLSADDLRALEQRTEGWAAGLQLAALSLQEEEDVAGFIRAFTGSHRYVFDYLAQEVLERQPDSVRTFLMRTSILERLSGSLCDALTERTDGQSTLERLEQANLFIVPLDQSRRWYRYHPLFADFLRAQLQQALGAHGILALHLQASEWHEQNGSIRDAVSHALAADDHTRAARLIEDYAPAMFLQSELTTLTGWIHRLPVEDVYARPRLCMANAWALLATGHGEEAERWLQAIERTLGASAEGLADEDSGRLSPDVLGALVEVTALRGVLAVGRFDVPRTLELSRRVLRHLGDSELRGLFNDPPQMRPAALFNLGLAQELGGEVGTAAGTFRETAAASLELKNQHLYPLALGHLGQLQVVQGQLHQAQLTYRSALQETQEFAGSPSPLSAIAHAGLGNVHYEWNDRDAALSHLLKGIELAKPWINWESLIPAYLGLARLKRSRGDLDGALTVLDEFIAMCRQSNAAMTSAAQAYQAVLWAARGDSAFATQWLREAGIDPAGDLAYGVEFEAIASAQVLIALGRAAEAARLLERLRQSAEAGHRTGRVIEISVWQSVAQHAQAKAPEALSVLERAVTLAAPEGYCRTFVDAGASLAELLAKLLTTRRLDLDETSSTYIRRLLDAMRVDREGKGAAAVRAQPSKSPPAGMAEALSDREMEVLRRLADGLTNAEIGQALVLSVNTVKTHVGNIYGKLGARNRAQAIARARELDLL